jgi:hypothetical protein
MREMLCFAAQNVPQKMDGTGLRDGFGHVRLGSDYARIGPALELTVRLRFAQLQLSVLEGKSCTEASFSQVEVAVQLRHGCCN